MTKSTKKKAKSSYDFTDKSFAALVDKHIENFFIKFNPDFEKHTAPIDFAEDEDSRMNQTLTNLHNSNQKLNTAFFEAYAIKSKDKNLTYAKVIEDYCKSLDVNQKLLFEFAANIIALHKIRWQIGERINNRKEESENQDAIEKSDSDFTTARKVLALYYMMNRLFKNESIPDKTNIARFIDSLISKKPSREIKNSNVYKKVKDLFFNPEGANEVDLLYVKGKFESLKMMDIITEIESTLTEIKQKKQ